MNGQPHRVLKIIAGIFTLIFVSGGSYYAGTQRNQPPVSSEYTVPSDQKTSISPTVTPSVVQTPYLTPTISTAATPIPKKVSPSPTVSPTHFQSSVLVSLSKSNYLNGEVVTVTIQNNTPSKVTYYGPICGLFFERKAGSAWQGQAINTFNSESDAQCSAAYFLESGDSLIKKITIDASPPQGQYRAVFRTDMNNYYSSEFNIN